MTNVYQQTPRIVNDKMVGGKYDGLPTYRVPTEYLEQQLGVVKKFEADLKANDEKIAATPTFVPATNEAIEHAEMNPFSEGLAVDEAAAAGASGSADPIPETSSGVE